MRSRVALIKGNDRYDNVLRALEHIADDIDLAGKRRIIIKPNFVSVRSPSSATHVDAVRAVLDFMVSRGAEGITLAEGPAMGTAEEGFDNYGYMPLVDQYGLNVVDLNTDIGIDVDLYDRHLDPLRLPVAKTVVESDYRISVGPPKTHNLVNVTLSLKNMAVGSLVKGKKSRVHQDCKAINLNLYKLAYHVAPHLAIHDGFEAMEGSGPVGGHSVDWRIAIASTDFLAADSLACQLMGFELDEIGYLTYCQMKGLGQGDLEHLELVGNCTFVEAARRFARHPDYQEKPKWHIAGVEQYL